jgi:hypothetical protein
MPLLVHGTQNVPASERLLNHDVALRPLADAEFEALATSYDLESDPIAVYPSTWQVAGDPKAALVEHLSPEHRDALDDDIIQYWVAPQRDACRRLRVLAGHDGSVSVKRALLLRARRRLRTL